jgi:isoamyl acetate esterase
LIQCFAKQDERQNVPKVRLLVIWLGANDAALTPSMQHVPIEQFITNLRKLVHAVTHLDSPRYSPGTRIILATPTPVEEILAAKTLESTARTFDVTKEYAMAVRDVGIAEGIPVADVWTRIWEESGKQERALGKYLVDGLHLSNAGYQVCLF